MYCIGLTGSIASGKSTVAKIFAGLGAEVISADKISRELTTSDKDIIQKISNKFGKDILDSNGQIKRSELRNIIFTDSKSRIWLEELLHPLIREKIELTLKNSNNELCIVEIPLLKSREPYAYLNHVIFITSSDEIKINRLMQRDNCTHTQALQILKSQPSTKEYESVSDTVIMNNGDKVELHEKIVNLLKQINKAPDQS